MRRDDFGCLLPGRLPRLPALERDWAASVAGGLCRADAVRLALERDGDRPAGTDLRPCSDLPAVCSWAVRSSPRARANSHHGGHGGNLCAAAPARHPRSHSSSSPAWLGGCPADGAAAFCDLPAACLLACPSGSVV